MRFIKTVFGKLGHQVEEFLSQRRIVAFLLCAGSDRLAVLGHFLRLFLAHRPTQHVRATERVTADDLGNLHDLLLIDDDAVSRLQRVFQVRVEIVDLLLPFLTQNKVIDHA